MTAVDKSTQKEVEMFLIAIQKNPPIMNLDQYADINRGLITAVCYDPTLFTYNLFLNVIIQFQNVSFMATYLVVLLQFKLTLLRQSARQAAHAMLSNRTMPEN